jgi:transmembrane 9 superfamily protein 2/4
MRIERNSLGGKLIVALLQIFIRVDEQCKTLCKIDALSANQAKAFKGKIEDDYRVLM